MELGDKQDGANRIHTQRLSIEPEGFADIEEIE